MSIFGNILGKIFKGPKSAAATQDSAAAASTAAPTVAASAAAPRPAQPSVAQAAPSPAGSPAATQALAPQANQVDVSAVLDELARGKQEKLNWKTSIVDLMKLLDLDSSLAERKALAKELNYSGDTNDSASMNIWLHKQVMKKLAENGGKVPAELRD